MPCCLAQSVKGAKPLGNLTGSGSQKPVVLRKTSEASGVLAYGRGSGLTHQPSPASIQQMSGLIPELSSLWNRGISDSRSAVCSFQSGPCRTPSGWGMTSSRYHRRQRFWARIQSPPFQKIMVTEGNRTVSPGRSLKCVCSCPANHRTPFSSGLKVADH